MFVQLFIHLAMKIGNYIHINFPKQLTNEQFEKYYFWKWYCDNTESVNLPTSMYTSISLKRDRESPISMDPNTYTRTLTFNPCSRFKFTTQGLNMLVSSLYTWLEPESFWAYARIEDAIWLAIASNDEDEGDDWMDCIVWERMFRKSSSALFSVEEKFKHWINYMKLTVLLCHLAHDTGMARLARVVAKGSI